MKNNVIYLFSIYCILTLVGCHSSYIYNTSLQLPSEPLEEKEVQISGELGVMPEASPESAGKHVQFAGGILIRYAPAKDFFLDGRIYTTLDEGYALNENPSGAGIGINFLMTDTKVNYIYGIRIFYERAWTGVDDGDAFGAQFFSWLPSFYSIRPYGAVGTGFAFSDEGFMGYGLIGNIGLSYEIYNHLDFNIEFSPIMQINTYQDVNHLVYSATAGLSFRL